ncbi:glycosyltransferase [Clostridium sp. 1001271B_151109_B4]|uniref:glycosyltransferase family 2 protein n=1 Tax=Clostridium sp. 1001271B_151109_B4 TaxID=2787148 RepID=UPI0018A9CCB0|nr:glycosyltransferase [Clostridium sp. 1001271B_151109_B4]
MKVSIIVPVYNVEEYLPKCLESLINQTLEEIEILCVNDGSTDNSRLVLEAYSRKSSKIKILDKKNGGLSDARNYGMEYAKGEYIGFVDSDDWVELNMFEIMYEKARQNDADICISNYREIYSDNTINIKDFNKEFTIVHEASVWNKLFRNSFVKEKRVKFPIGLWYEDNAFTYKLLISNPKIVNVNEYLYNYRKERAGSIMNSQINKKIYDIYFIGDEIYKYSQNTYISESEKIQLEFIFIRNIFFRQVLKIIKLEKNNILKLRKKLKHHYRYIEKKFPNWLKNEILIKDPDGYFNKKLGKNYMLIIKILRII